MSILRRFLPTSLLVALPLVLYAPFLFGGKVLYWGVYLLQFYPWRQLAVEQIRAGHWPLWNPYLGAGTPLAANLQTAAFYPPNLLFLLMPVERAFGWALALHVALAGLFAYYLGRTLGLSRFGALVTGLTYGLGGYLVAHWVFPSMVYAAAWPPLLLALTEKLISNIQYPKDIRYWIVDIALLSLVIALQLLAGHAQTSFYSLLIVAAFVLFRLGQQQAANGKCQVRQFLLATGYWLLATLWGFALAAIQLLPTAELLAHSQRAGRLTDLQFAYELSFWPWRLITLLAPDFFGHPARGEYWAYGTYWEEAAFIGVLPLLLAALAVARWWRKRTDSDRGPLALVPFLLLLSLFSFLLALGNHTPLYPLLFRYLPGFGLFQAPARLMIGYALGMALLAGMGAGILNAPPLRIRRGRQKVWGLLMVVGLGIGVAGGVTRLALPAVHTSFGSSMIRLGVSLTLAAGLLLSATKSKGKKTKSPPSSPPLASCLLPLASCLLIIADLLAFGWGLAPGTGPEVYRQPVATAQFLHTQPPGRLLVAYPYARQVYDRYVSLRSFGPTDPAHLRGLQESLIPNLNAIHHLPGVGNYDPLTIGLYRDLYDRCTSGNWQLCKLLGARYILSEEPLPLPVVYDAGPTIYRNDEALPEALVVFQARVIEDKTARLEALSDPAFDPRTEVLLSYLPPLECKTGSSLSYHDEDRTLQPEPSLLRDGPNRVIIQVNMVQAGYLVLTDIFYPGWQATVDGEPAEILPADHAFRAVSLDPGAHTIRFEYRPLSFRVGAWTTSGAALLLLLSLTIPWLNGKVYHDHRKPKKIPGTDRS